MGPEDRVRVQDMIGLTREAIAQFADVDEEQFRARRLYQTSLAWYVQAIGEAAGKVSDQARALFPDVPWKQIVGTRHILSHEYERVSAPKLWRVLRVHLPPLLASLEAGLHLLPSE